MDPTIQLTAAFALAAIFAASAVLKLSAPNEFRGAIENFRLIPEWAAAGISIAIPLCELGAAAGMAMPAFRAAGGLAAVGLLAMFSAAITINLARGRKHIDCGCFGPAMRQEISWWLVGRNVLLAIGAAIVALPAGGRAITPLDLFTAIAGAATAAALYAGANIIAFNAPRLRAFEAGNA